MKIESKSTQRFNNLKQEFETLHKTLVNQRNTMDEHNAETRTAISVFEEKMTAQIKSLDEKYSSLSSSIDKLSAEIKKAHQISE